MDNIMQAARRESAIETMHDVWFNKDLAKDLTRAEAVDYLVEMMLKEPDFWGVTTREEVEKEIYKCFPDMLSDENDVYYKFYRQGVMEELIRALKAMDLVDLMGKEMIIEYLVNQIMQSPECRIYDRKQAKVEAEEFVNKSLEK